MNNPYFSKSLRLLAHPLSLAAIGLMLANDSVFKALWPSWWTGKLSDFAGLFFLPFLAAAVLSLCAPGKWVGGLAFGITGAGFALLKLDPGANALLGGLGMQARLDPSDLLALVSLLPAAWLWRRETASPVIRLSWRLAALPLAALVTLGDAAAPDMGIACLEAGDGSIVAKAAYYEQSYVSNDGGLTWQVLEEQNMSNCSLQQDVPTLKTADGSLFWFRRGQGIDRSTDGGKTWAADFSLSGTSEQEQAYVRMTRSGNLSFQPGPYAAVIDSGTGNVVIAMGLDGVLVRSTAGQYSWVTVGPYQHDSLKQAGAAGVLLLVQNQVWLAALAALGWLFTRETRQLGKGRVWVILGWIGLGITSFLSAPQVASDGYIGIAAIISLFFMTAAALVALLVAGIKLKGQAIGLSVRALPQMALIGLAGLLPYVLWGAGVLPGYGWAILASVGLVVILMVVFSAGRGVKREA